MLFLEMLCKKSHSSHALYQKAFNSTPQEILGFISAPNKTELFCFCRRLSLFFSCLRRTRKAGFNLLSFCSLLYSAWPCPSRSSVARIFLEHLHKNRFVDGHWSHYQTWDPYRRFRRATQKRRIVSVKSRRRSRHGAFKAHRDDNGNDGIGAIPLALRAHESLCQAQLGWTLLAGLCSGTVLTVFCLPPLYVSFGSFYANTDRTSL